MHSWANEDDDIDKELMDQMKKDKEVNFHEFGIAPELYLDKQERKQILAKFKEKQVEIEAKIKRGDHFVTMTQTEKLITEGFHLIDS